MNSERIEAVLAEVLRDAVKCRLVSPSGAHEIFQSFREELARTILERIKGWAREGERAGGESEGEGTGGTEEVGTEQEEEPDTHPTLDAPLRSASSGSLRSPLSQSLPPACPTLHADVKALLAENGVAGVRKYRDSLVYQWVAILAPRGSSPEQRAEAAGEILRLVQGALEADCRDLKSVTAYVIAACRKMRQQPEARSAVRAALGIAG